RRKPDLMAPGCWMQSAVVETPCGTSRRGECATSYATPHAAAAAALVRQYLTEGWHVWGSHAPHAGVTPSGALLKAMLINSAGNMTGRGLRGYPTDREGWGVIRLDRVLYFGGEVRNLKFVDQRNGILTGEAHHYDFKVANGSRPLKVVLVWTDPPPGTAGAP